MKKNGSAASKNQPIRNRFSAQFLEIGCRKCDQIAASISGVQGKTKPKAPLQAERGEPGVQWPNWRAANSSPRIRPKRSDHRFRMASGQGRQTEVKTATANTICRQFESNKLPERNAAMHATT